MRRSSARERTALATPLVVPALVLAVGVFLFALFPRWLRLSRGLRRTDAVSMAYQKLLVHQHPGNNALRLRLAEMEKQAGELDDALETLAPLASSPAPSRAAALSFELRVASWQALPTNDPRREALEQALLTQLNDGLDVAWEPTALMARAQAALELTRPDLAARMFRDLALRPNSPDHSQGANAALRALHQALSSSEPIGDVNDFVAPLLHRYRDDKEVFEEAKAFLEAKGTRANLHDFWQKAAALRPDDDRPLTELLALSLADQQLSEAADEAETLAARAPNDVERRVTAARISEWAGRPERALTFWLSAARAGDREAFVEALRLAEQLHATRVLMTLLTSSNCPPASTGDLDNAVSILLETEEPEPALKDLRMLAGASAKRLGEAVLQLQTALDDHNGAAATLASTQGETPVVAAARLLWRMGRAREGLLLLTSEAGEKTNAERWHLAARLAWTLDDDASAIKAFQRLGESGNLDLDENRRLVLLLSRASPPQAVQEAVHLWGRTGNSSDYLLALSLAANSADRTWLDGLLSHAPANDSTLTQSSVYWQVMGETAAGHEHFAIAAEAYEHLWHLDPTPANEARLLWLALQDANNARLAHLYAEWKDSSISEPSLWRSMALAASRLGYNDDDIRFSELEANAHPEDVNWGLSLALALTKAGRLDAAAPLLTRLERHAQDDAATRVFVLSWLLTQHRHEEAVKVAHSLSTQALAALEPSLRLALAQAAADPIAMRHIVEHEGTSLPASQRVATWYELGEDRRALSEAYAALPTAPPGTSEALQSQIQSLQPLFATKAALGWQATSMPGLNVSDWQAGADWRHGSYSLGAHADAYQLSASPLETSEYRVSLTGRWQQATRTTAISAGWDGRPDAPPVLQLQATHEGALTPVLSWGGALHWHETELGSAGLRLFAVRDDATTRLLWKPLAGLGVTLEAGAQRYLERDGPSLSEGLLANAVADYALKEQGPRLHVRWTGSTQWNQLTGESPALPLGNAATWIPVNYTATGFGLVTANADLDDERRRLRLLAEAWGGWAWPVNRPVFRVRGAVAWRLGEHVSVGVDAFAAADQFSVTTPVVGLQAVLRMTFPY